MMILICHEIWLKWHFLVPQECVDFVMAACEFTNERERILFLSGCAKTPNPLVPSVEGRGRLAQLWHIFL